MKPMALSAGKIAKICGVPRTRIERIIREEIGITADTALRLSKAFGTSPDLWLGLQNEFDIRIARNLIGKELAKIEPVSDAA